VTLHSFTSNTRAQTHALAIGVGSYRCTLGGTGEINDAFDLPQLTSPPISAVAFAEWIIHSLRNPTAPLGTIEILTSPPLSFRLPNGQSCNSAEATTENVAASFQGWYQRLRSDAQNVGIFYFCGHGIMRRDLILLLSDFATNPTDPFNTAINFSRTYDGMGQCPAQTQCYFLDCCQQTPLLMSRYIDDPGRILIQPQFGKPHTGDAPKFLATAPSKSAYGMTNQVSLFTRELLDCLSRKGTRRKGGKWVVTTAALSEALGGTRSERSDQPTEQVYRTDGYFVGDSIIHELSMPPEIDVHLGCSPEAANELAAFNMKVSTPPHEPSYARPASPGIWRFRALANHYIASAEFPNGHYDPAQRAVWVLPPGPISEIIEC
jgi:Caspase domain